VPATCCATPWPARAAFTYWRSGTTAFATSPTPCSGRTLDSELYRRALDALGFRALTTDVKELVRVVRDGTVQAQENPLTNLLGFDLWKHHPHVSLTGHFFGVLLLVCPREWHAGLDQDQRARLQSMVDEATALQRRSAAAQDTTALERLRAHGVRIVGPDALDMPALRAATAAVRAQSLARLPAELVQAYLPAESRAQ
jgi:TRAP-type C4-dicarboxylate transport system substrate-binding protein